MLHLRQKGTSSKTVLESQQRWKSQTKPNERQPTKLSSLRQQTKHAISKIQTRQLSTRSWPERKQLRIRKRRKCKYPQYKLFHVAIKIGDVATQALVDTGASVSAISEFLFSRLPLETRSDRIESKDEKLNSICGQEIGINGIYEIPLSLDTDENKIKHQFYVIPKLTETCILGIDFLTRNSVILNSKTRQLSYVVNKNRITIDDEIKNIRKYKVTIKGAEVTLKSNGPIL
jgi:hypothetical protein